jgi:hypothetical protein
MLRSLHKESAMRSLADIGERIARLTSTERRLSA